MLHYRVDIITPRTRAKGGQYVNERSFVRGVMLSTHTITVEVFEGLKSELYYEPLDVWQLITINKWISFI